MVVFTHHLDVVNGLREAFPNAAVVTGEANMEARQAAVDAFTGDPNVRVFLGTYPGAAGVGLTLTSARVAVFAELDWVPGNVSQAEDRLHRIGQKNAVLIQHLVYDGSLDADMAQTIIDKQDVITVATDQPAELDNGDHAAFIKALPEPKQGSEPNKVSGWNEPLPTSVPF
ncbi:MAG: SWF/SNF helicase family protein [Alphaproteobacteria bacterium]|nr:SWF/SNF helicase family protein [Alphaproteobacteria bacterium]